MNTIGGRIIIHRQLTISYIVVVVTIHSTTVKGACDTVDDIVAILKKLNVPRDRFYIHVDGCVLLLLLCSQSINQSINRIRAGLTAYQRPLRRDPPLCLVAMREQAREFYPSPLFFLRTSPTTPTPTNPPSHFPNNPNTN